MRIHRNLHAARNGKPQWVETVRGRVAAYHPEILLRDVTTRVRPGGVARCQESGVRAVCAFYDGTRDDTDPILSVVEAAKDHAAPVDWQRVRFDPRRDGTFLAEALPFTPSLGEPEPWNHADAALMMRHGACYVLNPRWLS